MKKILYKFALFVGFLAYLYIMYLLLFDREIVQDVAVRDYAVGATNLVPFYTIKNFIYAYQNERVSLGYMFSNVVGNVLIFIPYPIFLEGLWKTFRKKRCLLPWSLATLLGVELTQLMTMRGSFDVDDIILNFIGVLIGHVFFVVMSRKFR